MLFTIFFILYKQRLFNIYFKLIYWKRCRLFYKMKFKLAYLYATGVYYIIPKFLKRNIVAKIIPFIHLPNKEWSILDTIDSITPVYQSCYTEKQVYALFERNNMHSIKKVNWGVSHIGKKI